MKRSELLQRLRGHVRKDEWPLLADGSAPLVISRWNRATLMRMRGFEAPPGEAKDEDVGAMEALLADYLKRTMPDRPEGHRWILLSCLFLAFVAREPLHPAEIVGHRPGPEGRVCPAREPGPDSLCRFCVCGPVSPGTPDSTPRPRG